MQGSIALSTPTSPPSDVARLDDPSGLTSMLTKEGKPSISHQISKDVPNPPNESDIMEINSMEQELLAQLLDTLRTEHIAERNINFLPQWIIDNAVKKELGNYSGAYEEHQISSLPFSANVISSHAFFHVTKDGEGNTLRLKCRLVPHGKADREKHELRSDCATAHFPVIRLIFSFCALYPFHLASIDIMGAYLQGKPLDRDIFMRLPKGWCRKDVVWKLIRPSYGLVDSGRIWQLTIENWLLKNRYQQVAGVPNVVLFVR